MSKIYQLRSDEGDGPEGPCFFRRELAEHVRDEINKLIRVLRMPSNSESKWDFDRVYLQDLRRHLGHDYMDEAPYVVVELDLYGGRQTGEDAIVVAGTVTPMAMEEMCHLLGAGRDLPEIPSHEEYGFPQSMRDKCRVAINEHMTSSDY